MSKTELQENWLSYTVIDLLKGQPNKEFTTSEIAKWIIKHEKYGQEVMLKKGFRDLPNDKDRASKLRGQITEAVKRERIQDIERRIKIEKKNDKLYLCYEIEKEDIESEHNRKKEIHQYPKKYDSDIKLKTIGFLKNNSGDEFSAGRIAVALLKDEKVLYEFSEEAIKEIVKKIRRKIKKLREDIKKDEPRIEIIEGNPIYFSYKEKSDDSKDGGTIEKNDAVLEKQNLGSIIEKEDSQSLSQANEKEEHLHEPLREFLYCEFGIYCKDINDKISRKKERGRNKWLHPDVVGIEIPKWEEAVDSCAKEYTNDKPNLWSFEIKLYVDKGDVREKFFQAVANSSWANFGYLVIGRIQASEKPIVMKELRMLSALHGIGCIQLDKYNPRESDILIPARKRTDADWYSVDRLAVENPDFLEYIKAIESISKGERIRREDWDYNPDWDKE